MLKVFSVEDECLVREGMHENDLLQKAFRLGFHKAAFMDVSDLVIVPEFRKYCEMNVCHCYDVNPSCPPKCGSIEEMTDRINAYSRVLVLQTEYASDFKDDIPGMVNAGREHNMLVDNYVSQCIKEGYIAENADDIGMGSMLRMSAGPYKHYSCMSAYCIDVQKVANNVGMDCWLNDGKCRLFTMLFFC